jgi:dipeptidyl aminopeptidase/acylaminoacyl peptidase
MRSRLFIALAAGAVAATAAMHADAQTRYRTPPDEVVRILDAPPPPMLSVDPTGRAAAVLERPSMPTIKEMAAPMLRLAGMRINPDTNGPYMPWASFTGVEIRSIPEGDTVSVSLPDGASLGMPQWSPDGTKFALTLTFDDRTELWVVSRGDGSAKRVGDFHVNAVLSSGFEWFPDSSNLLVAAVPADRGPVPQAPAVPAGPVVQETSGVTAPVRTYQDLLGDEHDEALFDYYGTSQLVFINSENGLARNLGEPALYREFESSPDRLHILTTRVLRPYSYLVPVYDFPDVTEVRNLRSNRVTQVVRRPLRDQTPIGGVDTGPRSVEWRATDDATLVWAEALDDGDPKKDVPHRDKVMAWSAPFEGDPIELVRTEDRFSGVQWVADSSLAIASEYDRDLRWARTWLIDADDPSQAPRLLNERSVQDGYSDPGRPVTTVNASGHSVVHVNNGHIFLSGRGASPEGDRPFLDRMSLVNFQTERLWRSEGEVYETFAELLAPDASRIMTSRESPTDPPNYFIRDLGAGELTQFTDYTDPANDFATAITKELVTYQRDDGVNLSATLYLPDDYQPGQRLPLVVWAYPREFNNASDAGQISGSPYRYTRISGTSHLFFLTQGYAVMDDATMPVVGDDPETVNDSFIRQIVASAQAAIDFAADRGVADPDRVGVGGHSYGAFMTANLLAHSDIFAAGIARSGAYNRTLTPFGFQSERRTYWEAPDVYFNLSPFMHADQINEPILMIHGMVDNNSGTFPIQSERLYHAVKGHGGTARLVMLPLESHGYRARESVMHTLAEMIDWFDAHVKNASSAATSQAN